MNIEISPNVDLNATIQAMIDRLTLVRNSVFTHGAERKSVENVIQGLKKILVSEEPN